MPKFKGRTSISATKNGSFKVEREWQVYGEIFYVDKCIITKNQNDALSFLNVIPTVTVVFNKENDLGITNTVVTENSLTA